MQLTDEQAVKGRWPDAWRGRGLVLGVYTYDPLICNRDMAIKLGPNWHEARQQTSVVEWERERSSELPPKTCPVCNHYLEQLGVEYGVPNDYIPCEYCSIKATIAEQADWIAVVEQQFTRKDDGEWVNLRADKLEEICHEQAARIEELESQVVNLMDKVEGVK